MAAALARQAAVRSRRVLAVDTLNSGALRQAIVASGGIDGTAGASISILDLTTQSSLDEYIKRYLHIPIPPSSLGPLSRIFDFVSAAAPGVKEILAVGKIGHEAKFEDWDQVVVDAPSSGHVIELLAAPASLRRLTPSGPLAGQTEWLQELLAGPTTSVVVVATPEELPTAETVQLVQRLAEETEVAIEALVVNRVPPAIDPAGIKEAEAFADQAEPATRTVAALASVAVDRSLCAAPFMAQLSQLADSIGVPLITVKDQPGHAVAAATEALSEAQW